MRTISERLSKTGTLVVSYVEDFISLGTMLNFHPQPDGTGKPTVELNPKAIKTAGLSIKPSFLKIASVIDEN